MIFEGFKGTGGFHEKDRKAIRSVCTLFLAIVVAFWGIKAVGYVFRERKLTLKNYENHLTIWPSQGGYSTWGGSVFNYGVLIECKNQSVTDLKIEMTAVFKTWSGEFVFDKKVVLEIDELEKRKNYYYEVLSDVSESYTVTYEVISISGGLS